MLSVGNTEGVRVSWTGTDDGRYRKGTGMVLTSRQTTTLEESNTRGNGETGVGRGHAVTVVFEEGRSRVSTGHRNGQQQPTALLQAAWLQKGRYLRSVAQQSASTDTIVVEGFKRRLAGARSIWILRFALSMGDKLACKAFVTTRRTRGYS